MPIQIVNEESIALLSTHFPQRNEPNYAWGNVLSGLLLTPRLRGQWGASSDERGGLYDHSGQGRVMAPGGVGTPPQAYQYGITPYCDFIAASSQYYTRADEVGLDITADLSMWCWVRGHAPITGVTAAIVGKWNTVAGSRGYLLYKNVNTLEFVVSTDGTATTTVQALPADYAVDEWRFVLGRFTPNTDLTLFIGNPYTGILAEYPNVAAIPATVFNTTQAFEVGRNTAASYWDGGLALWGLCAYSLPDVDVFNKFHQMRPLYMW